MLVYIVLFFSDMHAVHKGVLRGLCKWAAPNALKINRHANFPLSLRGYHLPQAGTASTRDVEISQMPCQRRLFDGRTKVQSKEECEVRSRICPHNKGELLRPIPTRPKTVADNATYTCRPSSLQSRREEILCQCMVALRAK